MSNEQEVENALLVARSMMQKGNSQSDIEQRLRHLGCSWNTISIVYKHVKKEECN